MAAGGNPFYAAQASAAVDPSQGQVPAGPGPSFPPGAAGAGSPYPDPMQGVQTPHPANFDEIAAIRDSILSQFPDLMAPDAPPTEMDTAQKLTLFGYYMANPAGAMDLIRERRAREARRQELRAELGMKALGVASGILSNQADTNKTILEMHLKANENWRANKKADLDEHISRGELAVKQASENRAAREQADRTQMNEQLIQNLNTGQDVGGNPQSRVGGGQETMGGASGAGAGAGVAGMSKSYTMGRGGVSLTLSDPKAGATRDPRVDFDGWLRGFITRFPGGAAGMPQSLSPDSSEGYQNLIKIWQNERSQLAPGSFGAASGGPLSQVPGPVRGQTTSPGYSDLSSPAS